MNLSKLIGIHAIDAALEYSPEKIQQAWVDENRKDEKLSRLINKLQHLKINIEFCQKKILDKKSNSGNHQGIVAEIILPAAKGEAELKAAVAKLTDPAFYLVLDQVQDPHNLGACIRTADAAGVHGLVVTKDHSSGLTATVCKVASGAAETVPVYQVTNLARTLRWFKEQHIWVVGTSGKANQSAFTMDFDLPVALVMGKEGSGLRQLTEKNCDYLVKIPMKGQVESLNLSVSAGILMYEIFKQRLGNPDFI